VTDPHLLDLWVRTEEGLVRADQIVHVHADSQNNLEVTLPLITTVGTTLPSIIQVTHTLGRISVADGKYADETFVNFLADLRSRLQTGVVNLDQGQLKHHNFPD
jgi:hypothetical protein